MSLFNYSIINSLLGITSASDNGLNPDRLFRTITLISSISPDKDVFISSNIYGTFVRVTNLPPLYPAIIISHDYQYL